MLDEEQALKEYSDKARKEYEDSEQIKLVKTFLKLEKKKLYMNC